ncbi:DUF305 domain-containing protein [Georgenia phoenicis]|uniref:DUF305 domain-containing protein n=1 Tax=unclassified Georgenia TaxID=2626815 RepID=UPI0039AF9876
MTLRTRLAAVAGGIALTLSLAACGNGEETTPEEPAAGTAAEETTDSSQTQAEDVHNDADTMFAQMMIVHHEGAIEMADLAVEKADSEEVRSLAERISAAQGPEIEKMTSWLEAWGEETSPMGGMEGMDHGDMDMEGMSQEEAMAELESLSDAEFDQRFLELMIAHHRGAVDMAQEELDGGENPEALDLAQKIIDDQQAEISEMEELLQGL